MSVSRRTTAHERIRRCARAATRYLDPCRRRRVAMPSSVPEPQARCSGSSCRSIRNAVPRPAADRGFASDDDRRRRHQDRHHARCAERRRRVVLPRQCNADLAAPLVIGRRARRPRSASSVATFGRKMDNPAIVLAYAAPRVCSSVRCRSCSPNLNRWRRRSHSSGRQSSAPSACSSACSSFTRPARFASHRV